MPVLTVAEPEFTIEDVPHRKYPCAECPFRRDTEPGQFTAERFEVLRATVGTDEDMRMPGDGLFTCHKSPEERPEVCAGWLNVCGIYHITVRLALGRGGLPKSVLAYHADWPELFDTYDEMAAIQGG